MSICHNAEKTCWSCPAVEFKGHVDFRACGQAAFRKAASGQLVVECKRMPDIGMFDPMSMTYDACPEWEKKQTGLLLKGMRVLILGIDGYLGWPLALRLAALGCRVFGIDNGVRRRLVQEKGADSVFPLPSMEERISQVRETQGLDIQYREMDIMDRDELFAYLAEAQPESVVQYAEIPSAPYSMANVDCAIRTVETNVLGTLGLLFGMRDHCPEASIIKLGTMGEYGSPLTGRPLFEGLFPGDAILQYRGEEWSLGGELVPRDPVSFYHVSKVQGTFAVYEACKYWWLRAYDVMQGVVYGGYTPETDADLILATRFDIDEWWGTVVNRFVAQTVMGAPMTIYGSGNQVRGYISLEDAMDCMIRLIASPPEPGQYDVVNQVTEVYSVREIAQMVAQIAADEFNLTPVIERLENPRIEAEEHPYEVLHEKLTKQFGFSGHRGMEEEIRYLFGRLTSLESMERIASMADALVPRTRWSGESTTPLKVLERITF